MKIRKMKNICKLFSELREKFSDRLVLSVSDKDSKEIGLAEILTARGPALSNGGFRILLHTTHMPDGCNSILKGASIELTYDGQRFNRQNFGHEWYACCESEKIGWNLVLGDTVVEKSRGKNHKVSELVPVVQEGIPEPAVWGTVGTGNGTFVELHPLNTRESE